MAKRKGGGKDVNISLSSPALLSPKHSCKVELSGGVGGACTGRVGGVGEGGVDYIESAWRNSR